MVTAPDAPAYVWDRSEQRLYAKQEAALFNPARYVCVEASTKSGKTHGCILWLLEQALVNGKPGREFWWVAPINAVSRIAYRRFRDSLRHIDGFEFNETEMSITCPNKARIVCQSGEHPDSLYGEDVWAAVIDEGTRCKAGVWTAIRSTLTYTKGPVRVIGNVVGNRNWAYKFARRCEEKMREGDTRYHYAKITAYDAIEAEILDEAEVEDARENLDDRMFKELYLAEPAESLSLIYAPFAAGNIDRRADYVGGGGPVYAFYDWGFTDNTHIGLFQYRDGTLYQFDELVGNGRSEQEWAEDVVRRIIALPDYDGPDFDAWQVIWKQNAAPTQWPNVWPTAAAGDPSAVQLRTEFKRHGISAYQPKKVIHTVVSGQDVLRSVIKSGADSRRLIIHPRCKETISALENYRARELSDGSYDPRPDPDPANHAFSHGCDMLRYGVWSLRRLFGIHLGGEQEEAA